MASHANQTGDDTTDTAATSPTPTPAPPIPEPTDHNTSVSPTENLEQHNTSNNKNFDCIYAAANQSGPDNLGNVGNTLSSDIQTPPDPSKLDTSMNFVYDDNHQYADIIPPNERGDAGAMYDALNKVGLYSLLAASQNKYDAYINFSDVRVSNLDQNFTELNDKIKRFNSSIDANTRSINSIQNGKVSVQEFNVLKSEFNQFTLSCDLALEQAKTVYSEQQHSLDLHRQLITNTNLVVRRSHKDFVDLSERLNVTEIRAQFLNITIE